MLIQCKIGIYSKYELPVKILTLRKTLDYI